MQEFFHQQYHPHFTWKFGNFRDYINMLRPLRVIWSKHGFSVSLVLYNQIWIYGCFTLPIWSYLNLIFEQICWNILAVTLPLSRTVSETYTCVILNNVYPLGASSSQGSRSALAASASAWFIFASSWIQPKIALDWLLAQQLSFHFKVRVQD